MRRRRPPTKFEFWFVTWGLIAQLAMVVAIFAMLAAIIVKVTP